jgi:phage terminase large subunit-like protein
VPGEAVEAGIAAEPVVDFAEAFGIITKDSVAGKSGSPLVLRDWQQRLVEHVFAHDKDGLRHRINLLGMARKSGKSALGSVLSLYSLILGPGGAEVYSIAAEKEQARIVFQDAKRMIEASSELSAITKLYRDAVELPALGSVYRVLSAEAYSKEGLNPSFVLFDELHAQPNRELFDVMSLAMGARGNLATLVAITTAGVKSDSTGRDSIAYSLYQYGQKVARGEIDDPTFFMAWWEDDGDYRLEETWRKANPGFGDLSDPKDFESAVRRTPEAEFRTKRCNQWVSSQTSWLPVGAWDACENKFYVADDDEIILGFDGSYSGDASVIVGAVVPKDDEPIRVFLVKAWEKDLAVHDPEWRVDTLEVEQTIEAFCQAHPNVREIVCDPFRWQRSMAVLEDKGLPIVAFPQSPSRMIKACATFYDAVVEQRVEHNGDPILSRHLDNTMTKMTPAGPHVKKENPNSPRKIDAAVAAIMATDRASVGRIEEVVPQFFF